MSNIFNSFKLTQYRSEFSGGIPYKSALLCLQCCRFDHTTLQLDPKKTFRDDNYFSTQQIVSILVLQPELEPSAAQLCDILAQGYFGVDSARASRDLPIGSTRTTTDEE